MNLQALRSALSDQIAGPTATAQVLGALASASMPASSAVASALTTQLAVTGDLAVGNAQLEAGDDSLVVLQGKADVLGTTGAQVTVTFTASDSNAWPDLQVVVIPAAGWHLGSSFPVLIGTPADLLSLHGPTFVFTTATGTHYAWTDSTSAAQDSLLQAGLNFVADLLPNNVIGLIGELLQGGVQNVHVPLSGTFDLAVVSADHPSPAVSLQGPLGKPLLPAELFTLGSPMVVLANDPAQSIGVTALPRVLLSVPVLSGDTPLLVLAAPVGGIDSGLSLSVTGANGGLTLETIATLLGGQAINDDLPPFLQDAFETIAFKSFWVDLATPTMRPLQIGVSIGTVLPWGVAEFQVQSTTLTYHLSDPLGAKLGYRTFSAALSIFPSVFPGTFDLLVEDDPEQTAVSADYHGQVTLDALVSGLSANAVVLPKGLPQVTFSDFGFGFTYSNAGWDWQLYGKAEATFTLPLLTSGQVQASLLANISSTGGQRAYQLVGALEIGTAYFSLELDLGPTSNLLTGTWQLTGGDTLEFEDLAAAVHLPAPPQIPPELKLALNSAELQYDFTTSSLMLTATSANYGQALFVAVASTSPALYAFGLSIHLGARLADLPLVGSRIPDGQNLGIDTATVWILSRAATKAEVEVLNARAAAAQFPALPDGDIASPVILSADLLVGTGTPVPMMVMLGGSTPAPAPIPPSLGEGTDSATLPAVTASPTAAAQASGDSTVWLNVQRQIGPFTFNRVGIGYQSGQLRFALDAGIALGPFALSLDGLSISSPLTDFAPSFDLSGLGLSFNRPPLQIASALRKLSGADLSPLTNYQFDGTVVLSTEKFAISGIGSYAQLTSGDPSLFIFAQLSMPLGGPPAFFVTGLMAGVGFNRALTIPGMDQVQSFPLLTLGQPPAPGQPAVPQDPMQVLRILEGQDAPPGGTAQPWIAPKPGAFWFAAGIEFTSFKLANTRAMLIVEENDALTIAVLGLSKIQLPLPEQDTPTYAYAELQIRIVLQPQDGVFMASAILSNNSYVLTPQCHLTGGFAFAVWFGSNAHAGDFVVTLGGYHPAFVVPAHYPAVPRLGFNWAVSDTVAIKGDAYFALTPSCAMGGGGLEVLFQSGDLRAWFTAQADVLVSWRPFFFVAAIDVSIGVSYRLNLLVCHKTISLSIGASLDLWGPPTGGKVHVHLVVVTFTVGFGSDSAGTDQTPLDWTGLKALLPATTSICAVTPQGALAGSADSTDSTSQKRWFVRPRGFSFATQSAIPAGTLTHTGGPQLADGDPATIAIKPMNLGSVLSTHAVQITSGTPTGAPVDTSGWSFTPRTQTVPDALWGAPPSPFSQIPSVPSAKTLADTLAGYTIAIPEPALGAQVGAIAFAELLEEYISPAGQAPLSQAVVSTAAYVPAPSTATIAQIAALDTGSAAAGRAAVFAALSGAGVYGGSTGSLARMAAGAAHLFTDAPLQQG